MQISLRRLEVSIAIATEHTNIQEVFSSPIAIESNRCINLELSPAETRVESRYNKKQIFLLSLLHSSFVSNSLSILTFFLLLIFLFFFSACHHRHRNGRLTVINKWIIPTYTKANDSLTWFFFWTLFWWIPS